ncbi:MAG: Asp-tRNA(Asn)/Glu-tRNA(Gln) amidotransferase GatCAB subunit A [Gammaproteobacteria bacterium]|nr:Asp-tRNA(Asn)/Glu-tRNA(Gln) amidotransferase GatCAB subunit A [Gammaproteobacteria bacterium]
MTAPLHYQTIAELAPQLASRSLSPVELTRAMLERIAVHDPHLHAYATVMADHALAQAQAAERDIAAGRYRGPLHGVPVAVKDLCCTAGVPTMGGCKVLADHVPDFDATVVTRLRQAGAVLLGKLNLTEGAMAGYNPDFEVPENPWKKEHWSGASSSGCGAATAAGLAFGTLGSDTGGSIRHPAAACGTVGLKPTWGRVSRYGVLDLAQSLDHVGPLTRSSYDAGVMSETIAGHDPNDPTSLCMAPPPWQPTVAASDAKPLAGMRVGWDEHYASEDMAADFSAAVKHSAEVLERLGAAIIAVKMPPRLREYMAAWQVLCSSEAAHAHRNTYPSRAMDYGLWFREWLEQGSRYSSRDYADAHFLRAACNGELAVTMQSIDVLACPSTPRAAYPVTAQRSYGPIPANRDPWDSRFTVPADYAGLPTLSLPCGLSAQGGLPLSFQLMGHRLSEAQLVYIGTAFEGATGWHTLHPPEWWLD